MEDKEKISEENKEARSKCQKKYREKNKLKK